MNFIWWKGIAGEIFTGRRNEGKVVFDFPRNVRTSWACSVAAKYTLGVVLPEGKHQPANCKSLEENNGVRQTWQAIEYVGVRLGVAEAW